MQGRLVKVPQHVHGIKYRKQKKCGFSLPICVFSGHDSVFVFQNCARGLLYNVPSNGRILNRCAFLRCTPQHMCAQPRKYGCHAPGAKDVLFFPPAYYHCYSRGARDNDLELTGYKINVDTRIEQNESSALTQTSAQGGGGG